MNSCERQELYFNSRFPLIVKLVILIKIMAMKFSIYIFLLNVQDSENLKRDFAFNFLTSPCKTTFK